MVRCPKPGFASPTHHSQSNTDLVVNVVEPSGVHDAGQAVESEATFAHFPATSHRGGMVESWTCLHHVLAMGQRRQCLCHYRTIAEPVGIFNPFSGLRHIAPLRNNSQHCCCCQHREKTESKALTNDATDLTRRIPHACSSACRFQTHLLGDFTSAEFPPLVLHAYGFPFFSNGLGV